MAQPRPTRELNAVLIGAGMVAGTHVAALRDAAGVRLHGVWSRTAEKAAALAGPEGARIYADLAEVAADPEVDFAILLTPPNARADMIAPLIAAGMPILMEKPVARDGAEARALVDQCAAAGVTLGIRVPAPGCARRRKPRRRWSPRAGLVRWGWWRSPFRGGAASPITTNPAAAPMRATAAAC